MVKGVLLAKRGTPHQAQKNPSLMTQKRPAVIIKC